MRLPPGQRGPRTIGPPLIIVPTNYRSHQTPNDCPFGWVDEGYDGNRRIRRPLDGSGSVQRLFAVSFVSDWFGRTIVGSSDKRLRALHATRWELRLGTTQEIQMAAWGARSACSIERSLLAAGETLRPRRDAHSPVPNSLWLRGPGEFDRRRAMLRRFMGSF